MLWQDVIIRLGQMASSVLQRYEKGGIPRLSNTSKHPMAFYSRPASLQFKKLATFTQSETTGPSTPTTAVVA